ncbi:MAG: hypothetical protein HC926_05880 [Synechococcaceae cyanobacterium SM2_3_60]|nr:hypothetical protein [Synechococcaceae cyanobacterium SM2_3_60]
MLPVAAQQAQEDLFIEQMLQRASQPPQRSLGYRVLNWLQPQFAQANPTIQGDPNNWLIANDLPQSRTFRNDVLPENCDIICEIPPPRKA